MPEVDLQVAARALLFKIHVITGWVMSEEKEYRNVLVDQFTKKLDESYGDVNIDEFEYAIRSYGTTVKDWGKQINLSLIDEVMIPYLTKRSEISQIEENKSKMIEEPKLQDITNQDWYNQTKELVRNRKLTVEFVPLPLYDYAIKQELIQPATVMKWEYLKMATEYRQGKLYANVQMDSTKENNTLFSEFMRMKREGFTGDEKERLISLSKKMILFDSMLSK